MCVRVGNFLMLGRARNPQIRASSLFTEIPAVFQRNSLFGHPGRVLKGQLSTANLVLEQVDVLPELTDGIQWGIVEETQTTHLGRSA